jgi:hypothetical protein
MRSIATLPALLLFASCLAAPAAHAVGVNATLSASVDDSDGRNLDADLAVAPSEHFDFNLGVGHYQSSAETSDVEGTLWRVGASVRGERAGFSLGYDQFADGSNYQSATLGARAAISAADFTFALLGRHRELALTLELQLPLRLVRREVDFTATGFGGEVSWATGPWSAYVSGLAYEYDESFEDFIALARSPQLATRPRIEAWVATFVTQAQGAIDREARAGIERAFGRQSLALDVANVHDAIADASSTSVVITWSFAQSSRFDWSVSGGVVESEAFGDVGFAGVALGISH